MCSNGWYRLIAHASGPGGLAENNGASVTKYVYGRVIAVAPNAQNARFGAAIPASISSECKIHYEPI